MPDPAVSLLVGDPAPTGASQDLRRNDFASGILIFLAYAVTAGVGMMWATVAGAASPIWPAAGVAVALLSICGVRFWPGIAFGLFAAAQLTGATHPLGSQLAIALGNALAAVVGALLLIRLSAPAKPDLSSLRAVLALLAAGLVAAAIAAMVGATALIAVGQVTRDLFPDVLVLWFLGDAVGVFVFASFILAVSEARRADWSSGEIVHLAAVLGGAALLSAVIFFGPETVRTFYLFPLLTWAALMLRPVGATAAMVIVALVAIAGTTLGHGPFSLAGAANFQVLQQFLSLTPLVVIALAAVGQERRAEVLRRAGAAEALAASRLAELTSLYSSAPIGLAFFDRDYRYLRINAELAAINGVSAADHIGRTIREVLPANAPTVEPIIDRIFETGKPVRDVEVAGETPQQPGVERHWLTGFYPVRGNDGAVDAVGIWVIEITDRKAAEQRETLLAREVDHRAKNLLAVVQSIVQLTPGEDGPELKNSVIGRIQALASAHSLLSESRWEGADLGHLVAEELAPFASGSKRVRASGPALQLRPPAAQSLGLVLHELATNAAKYGALSNDAGTLRIDWRRGKDESGAFVEIQWVETGGPAVVEPSRLGFGSNIIRASVERHLRGRVTKEWAADGVRCTIRIPAAEIVSKAQG